MEDGDQARPFYTLLDDLVDLQARLGDEHARVERQLRVSLIENSRLQATNTSLANKLKSASGVSLSDCGVLSDCKVDGRRAPLGTADEQETIAPSEGLAQVELHSALAMSARHGRRRPFTKRPGPGRPPQLMSTRQSRPAELDIQEDLGACQQDAQAEDTSEWSPARELTDETAATAATCDTQIVMELQRGAVRHQGAQRAASAVIVNSKVVDATSNPSEREHHQVQGDGEDASPARSSRCSQSSSFSQREQRFSTTSFLSNIHTGASRISNSKSKRTFRQRDSEEAADDLRKMQALWAGAEENDGVIVSYLDEAAGLKQPCWQATATMIANHTAFQVFFAVCIVANSIWLGIEVDHSVSHPNENSPLVFYVIGYAFVLAFLVELLIRLASLGCSFFCGESCLWNLLDFVIVLASVAEVGWDIKSGSVGSGKDEGSQRGGQVSNVRIFRIIRLTRLLRIFRIARIVKLIRALKLLVVQIMGTLRAVFWALVLMLIIIYVFAIVFSQAASNHVSDGNYADADPITLEAKQQLLKYWGSLPRSMFSLYKSIIGGVDWEVMVIPLSDIHWFWVMLFVLFISFTFFAMLNVMTGVFCQSAIESAQHDQDVVIQQHLLRKKMYIKKIQGLFAEIGDSGPTEVITYRAFEAHLNEEKVHAYFESLGLDTSDAWGLFKLLDTDESQQVDIEEFVMGCLRLRGPAKAVDVAKLSYDNKILRKKMSSWMRLIEEMIQSVGHDASRAQEQRQRDFVSYASASGSRLAFDLDTVKAQ